MAYKYKHFIPQNTAPSGAEFIRVYDNKGAEVCTIPLGRMTQPTKQPEYSFGLVSDIHVTTQAIHDSWEEAKRWYPNPKFENALKYFKNQECNFCVICGDLTQSGFHLAANTPINVGEFKVYEEICGKEESISPVYEIMGNHESYEMPIEGDLNVLPNYVGKEGQIENNFQLHYKVEYKGDIFIFCGQPDETVPMSEDAYKFLEGILSNPENKDKRCFVFVHPVFISDSGDVCQVYENNENAGRPLLSLWNRGEELKTLLKSHPKVVLFHGHTHIKFEEQAKDKTLNYTQNNEFHSVHIPSLGRPRDVFPDKPKTEQMVYCQFDSQGYIVDVYDDCIVLNGFSYPHKLENGAIIPAVENPIPVPLGTYKIDIATNKG